jgi:DNA polymerase III epsilon subunit-like protein
MAESISPACRTTAHDHKQLAAVLGWTVVQVDKAVVLGVLPPYDLRTPRWRAVTVDALAEREHALAAALDEGALLTAGEMMSRLGLDYGDWRRGFDAGVIPAPDAGGFWSKAVADGLAARSAELKEQIPPQPLGLSRCTALLTELTELDVTGADLRWLSKHGHVDVVDYYKEWPLYDVAAVRRLGATPEGRELVAGVVAERIAWLENSITTEDAAQWLEWDRRDLERVAAEQGITHGRFGRWAREDIARLAGDEELAERVRRERLLGPDQAAEYMEIRRTDFDYVTAAGWVAPARHVTRGVGRYKTVQVPLYQVGDLEDALATPGVDWEAVHTVKPGEESPLREFTRLPRSRAETVRAFCNQVSYRWQVEFWPWFWNAGNQWQIDWEQRADGHPTKDEVAEALAAHHGASRHAGRIELSTAVGDVIRRARACLEPGAAVICDFETTDLGGVGIEVAVIDACTGAVLLDTLISPDGVQVEDGARAVHGITDAELADAPCWRDIAPKFLAAVDGKMILAYNAPFDSDTAAITHEHADLPAGQLPPRQRWWCLMEALSTWHRVGWWYPLGGGHRALGDAEAARQVLLQLAAPVDSYRAARSTRR